MLHRANGLFRAWRIANMFFLQFFFSLLDLGRFDTARFAISIYIYIFASFNSSFSLSMFLVKIVFRIEIKRISSLRYAKHSDTPVARARRG